MNYLEFANIIKKFLNEKIEEHKKKTCEGKNSPTFAAYAQAHTHLIEYLDIIIYSQELKELFEKTKEETTNKDIAYWIRKKEDKSHYSYYCSNCNTKSRFRMSKYCPECGYKMVKGEDAHE